MASPDVIKPGPAMVSPYSVKGYRPDSMDVPTGPVLKTGPRRPAGGYSNNTPTKAPGAIVKPHTATRTVIPAVNQRKRSGATVTPRRGIGLKQRVIVPHNGVSLPNANRV